MVGFANTANRTEVEAGALLSLAISVLRFISDLKYGDYSLLRCIIWLSREPYREIGNPIHTDTGSGRSMC